MNLDFTVVPTLTLCAMMLGLGLGLEPADFTRLVRQPRAVAIGAAGQLLLLPVVALVVVQLLPLAPATAVGLMIVAACPGGATSNVFSRYARGDVALSITLTAVSSVLAPLWVPLVVGIGTRVALGAATEFRMSTLEMAVSLASTTALPVALGMMWRQARPASARRLRRPLLAVATAVLVLLVVGLGINTILTRDDPAGLVWRSLPAVSLLMVITVSVAAASARAAGLTALQSRTLVIELGIQNVNLALVVAVSLLGEQDYLGPMLVYLPMMLLLALVVVAAARLASV